MSSKKFHFVKYEFGSIEAGNGKEASMLISNLETAIIWKEADFEFQAKKLEATEGKTLFDRKKFIPAFYEMIKNHNPIEDISVSTIEKYLHTFCKMDS